MRHVLYGIRVILELAGIMLAVTSWLVRNRGATVANAILLAGALLIIAALFIRRRISLKRCPRCAEKVEIKTASFKQSACRSSGTLFAHLSAGQLELTGLRNKRLMS